MFASRHAVFVGPGKLNDELRLVLAKRAGAPQPDVAIQVPRLLATFETAAEAERIASQVQRLKLGGAVAGPEQPPAELSWAVAKTFGFFDKSWRLETANDEVVHFQASDVTAVTLLDWRPDEGAPDRAALITLREGRPVMLRASLLDEVSRHSAPIEGIRRINEFLDAVALVLTPAARVRSRRLNEADFRGDELAGDLLPLVLAVVDGVDTMPGQLPQPLQGKRPPAPTLTAHYTGLAALSAWVLYVVSLGAMVLSLGYLTVAALSFGLTAALAGFVLAAWGTRRFMWSRWLGRSNWGEASPIPPFPIAATEPGIKPHWFELVLDTFLIGTIGSCALGEGLLRAMSLASLPVIAIAVLCSAAAVYEAWQRD
ncbi:MAG: hypothetical protein DI536_20460 [Archangium gephyra]|uniref:Uncharacterized protein n=1 Tax=Archangium gephyra TaxID=48 RepID=A0A2W5VIJ2_9BACT|nr:MAG: hypothetical protein DI536_20460 [Archangium gephyra]